MGVLIEFTKDFATKKKGDTMEVNGMLARDLMNKKVAKKRERKTKTTK
jgi:hypothetical protein